MQKITAENLTWIDIKQPTEGNVKELKEKFNLHPLILQEILPPSYRSKVDEYDEQLFLVLYFPVFDKKTRQTKTRELDIIISGNVLITSHYLSILPLKKLFTRCNLYQEERKKYFGKGPGILLYHIIEELLQASLPKLDHISKNIEGVEEKIFLGKEKEMVTEISIIKRDILNMSKAIKPKRTVLQSLAVVGPKLFGQRAKVYFQDIISTYEYVRSVMDNHQEMIEALQETNESLLSNKISEIMKVLTVVSFITFPLAVIAGIFGMNVFSNIAFTNNPATFWIIIIIMLFLAGIMAIIFRNKKWL